ncbi:MAG: M28 family peptidase [Planctomycetia bacterium]|nr:M28 family peptidase [Planctomycetia bacterium]
MSHAGWHQLIPKDDYLKGDSEFHINAYSEYMPPPRVGWKPYGPVPINNYLFSRDDPYGWKVHEFDEALELQPGLHQIARDLLRRLKRLQDGNPDTGLPRHISRENPFWPAELAQANLKNDPCVLLLPISLSRTQDDKGRVRWTLFGNSEQGPSKAFWKSFYTAPGVEAPAEDGIQFFCRLLNSVYGISVSDSNDLRQAGLRILTDDKPDFPFWSEGELPSWTKPFQFQDDEPSEAVKYLVTFRPFGRMPVAVREGYLKGRLALLPFPGSLVFWGVDRARRIYPQLPLGLQIPLLANVDYHESPIGIRVPQSGLFHQPTSEQPEYANTAGHLRNTFKRTHRWQKILRDQDQIELIGQESSLLNVWFSTVPEDLGLYGKPMARNVQIWTQKPELLLDGPNASPSQIKKTIRAVKAGGVFGYRFLFPAMRVGHHEVYWHRPLVAFRNSAGETAVVDDAPLGYFTAYDAEKPRLERAIELWPRMQKRDVLMTALEGEDYTRKRQVPIQVRNVRKLTHAYALFGAKPLPVQFARRIMGLDREGAGKRWLAKLPEQVANRIREIVVPDQSPELKIKAGRIPESLTYSNTANRSFEVDYWKTIASLAESPLINKNNADCVLDEATQQVIPYHERQLDQLGDDLLAYYQKAIKAARMTGKALAGDVPFQWRTDADYSWMGGWRKNEKTRAERNLLIMIPGRNCSEAVIMADHYDTAFMEDKYETERGGTGARLAACGADDNYSATASLMLAAPIFLEMSRQGKLGCDIWLVHLTGEEFPADCLGARALAARLVSRSLKLRLPNGKTRDLSKVTVRGLYVSDMIAYNHDHERDIFQISPGNEPASMWLAYQAHIANEIWNTSVPYWNKSQKRLGLPRSRRSPHGAAIPEMAPFLELSGHVRVPSDPKSTLFNTDAQIFSDVGVPCVLFMENYDINRTGYHDTHDTMENIDLDYGAAVCAITIESVARAAKPETVHYDLTTT